MASAGKALMISPIPARKRPALSGDPHAACRRVQRGSAEICTGQWNALADFATITFQAILQVPKLPAHSLTTSTAQAW